MRHNALLMLMLVLLLQPGCKNPPRTSRPSQTTYTTIYIVSHGWHTGLVVPRDAIADHLWPEHRELPEATYIEIGWGDQDYYQAEHVTLGLLLKAALWGTPSVLHLVWFNTPVVEYFPTSEIIAIDVAEQPFEALCTFIHRSYQTDGHGKTVPLERGLYGRSRFYQAQGTYHLFNNCNTWLAQALLTAGCSAISKHAITATHILRRAQQCGRLVRPQTDLRQ